MLSLFDLFAIFFTFLAGSFAWKYTSVYGNWYGIVGVVIGGLLGWKIGWLPYYIVIWFMKRKMVNCSTEELKKLLFEFKFPGTFSPNILLLELKARGEDMNKYLDFVLGKLEAGNASERTFWYAGITSAYPELVKHLDEYKPQGTKEKCQACVSKLREYLNRENII